VVQDYSAAKTYSWNTTGLALGQYGLRVDARDVGAVADYETVATAYYNLADPPCATPTVAVSPVSPQGVGTMITFTTTTTNCPRPLYEFWMLAPGGSWTLVQGYSSNASFTVDSDDQITAVVDRNAVTGKITVVTPAAAGTSAFDFTVLPFDNFARIASILDVPHDQGGQVTLRWLRSDFDDPTDHLISGYRVWRRAPLEGVSAAAAHPTWRHEVTASGEIVYWEPMTLVPAAFLDGYAYVSPTTQDSTEDGNPFTAFFIQTLTSDPTVFYNSPVDSGYSVDNEPPHKPPKFKAQGVNHKYKLDWGGNVERDFFAYRLHRGATMTFTPDSLNTVYFGADTGWVDTLGAGSYYKLAAVDRHGNVSKYALVTPSGSTTSVAFTVSSQVGPEPIGTILTSC